MCSRFLRCQLHLKYFESNVTTFMVWLMAAQSYCIGMIYIVYKFLCLTDLYVV